MVRQIVPERTLRIWVLYTAGSAAAFERGEISVSHILLRKPGRTAELHTRKTGMQRSRPPESISPRGFCEAVPTRAISFRIRRGVG